jgi:hypothetical protein
MLRDFSKTHRSTRLFSHIWVLAALYCVASLVHFTHNAEYISHYPNMPAWLTREHVYMVWTAVTSAGVAALLLHVRGRRFASVLCLAAYGAFGFDALGHYAVALCSQHTLAQNFTIWVEVAAGAALVCSCIFYLKSYRSHAVRPFR